MLTTNNLAWLLARTARNWPRLPAVAMGATVLYDYATLARRVAGLGAAMRASGLLPGERVAIVSRNVPAYIETVFACWWVGLTAVPVNAKLHARELAYVLDNSNARWVFADEDWVEALQDADIVPTSLEHVQRLGDAAYEVLVAHAGTAEPDGRLWASGSW